MNTDSTIQTKSTRSSNDELAREKMAARVTGSAFVWLALFILGLAVLLWISGSGMAELMWTRYIYLLTGVETVAFAALGWLFGREVHRQQVSDANQRAEDSLQEERAAKGKMIQVMQQAMQEKQQIMGTLQQTTRRASDSVFIHTASDSNTDEHYPHCTFIDSPYTNNNPNAIIFVTQNWIGNRVINNNHSIGVWYNTEPEKWPGKWSIFNEDKAPMPPKAAFNVMVIDGSGT